MQERCRERPPRRRGGSRSAPWRRRPRNYRREGALRRLQRPPVRHRDPGGRSAIATCRARSRCRRSQSRRAAADLRPPRARRRDRELDLDGLVGDGPAAVDFRHILAAHRDRRRRAFGRAGLRFATRNRRTAGATASGQMRRAERTPVPVASPSTSMPRGSAGVPSVRRGRRRCPGHAAPGAPGSLRPRQTSRSPDIVEQTGASPAVDPARTRVAAAQRADPAGAPGGTSSPSRRTRVAAALEFEIAQGERRRSSSH